MHWRTCWSNLRNRDCSFRSLVISSPISYLEFSPTDNYNLFVFFVKPRALIQMQMDFIEI